MTGYLLNLCLASASSHLLFNERRVIRRGRSFVVSSSRRPTTPPSRQFRQRRWRSAHASLFRKKPRLLTLSPSSSPFPSAAASAIPPDFLHNVARTLSSHTAGPATAADIPHIPNPIDVVAVEHLFDLSAARMEAHPPRPRAASPASSGSSVSSGSSGMSDGSYSETMPPPPLPTSTPVDGTATAAGAGATRGSMESQDGFVGGGLSRSASTASRTNRLSLTLPISLSNGLPVKPLSASSAGGSYPVTPNDPLSALTSPAEPPADFIQAIAAQERRVLELREELGRAEKNLTKLKRHWANHEVQKKRAEIRRTEQMRPLSARPARSATDSAGNIYSNSNGAEDAASKRAADMDRRKALLRSQTTGSLVPDTPTQSRRRVFTGGHTRTLSLLSPTKTSSSDSFSMLGEDQTDDDFMRSPSSQVSDSPFYQQLNRIAPNAAAQLSKRASWAPQSAHQVGHLKQVAGELSTTLWTFVEDLRQATVGDEAISGNAGPAMRTIDGNSRQFSEGGDQQTIRASSSARPSANRVFSAGDAQSTPSPASRRAGASGQKEKAGLAESSGNGKAKSAKAAAAAKPAKRFSWAPLTVDQYDDSEWASWDSPTVKSPRWSGSTANGDAASIAEEANENVTPVKKYSSSTQSPHSGNRGSVDIDWQAALKGLTPSSIKRTATDFMKEWEKSLNEPFDSESGPAPPPVMASTSAEEGAQRPTTNA